MADRCRRSAISCQRTEGVLTDLESIDNHLVWNSHSEFLRTLRIISSTGASSGRFLLISNWDKLQKKLPRFVCIVWRARQLFLHSEIRMKGRREERVRAGSGLDKCLQPLRLWNVLRVDPVASLRPDSEVPSSSCGHGTLICWRERTGNHTTITLATQAERSMWHTPLTISLRVRSRIAETNARQWWLW